MRVTKQTKKDNVFPIIDKPYSFTCVHAALTKQMIDFFNEANISYDYRNKQFIVASKDADLTKSTFNYLKQKLHDKKVYGIEKYYWEK